MPCGGIYPVKGTWLEELPKGTGKPYCWQCGKTKPVPNHFCDEWDTYIHRNCIPAFLLTPEGKCVMDHGHEVIIAES